MNDAPRWAEDGGDAAAADALAEAIAGSPAPLLALPGGSTPAPVFADLATRPLDWSAVTLMPTDERLAPAGHEARNLRLLARAFDGTGAHLQALDEGPLLRLPSFVCLGMGEDGHVASLFPAMEAGAEAWSGPPRIVATEPQPLPEDAPYPRLSLNLPAILAAPLLMLLIRGQAKKRVLEEALAGASDLPVARLARAAGNRLTVFWAEGA